MYKTESQRWQAIATRDLAASSSFVYAVISTKIYCRPGCPSRLARRANVCFYDTGADAVAAGYRPCLRCKPERQSFDLDKETASKEAVKRACEYIEQTKGQVKFSDVAKHVGLSTRYLYGLFKNITGTTPAKYAAGFKTDQTPKMSTDTPSAVSTVLDQDFDFASDAHAWDPSTDLGYQEILSQNFSFPFEHSNVCDSSLLMPGTSDQQAASDNLIDSILYKQLDFFSLDPNFWDPARYQYQP